jgi:hypothetical protein
MNLTKLCTLKCFICWNSFIHIVSSHIHFTEGSGHVLAYQAIEIHKIKSVFTSLGASLLPECQCIQFIFTCVAPLMCMNQGI